MECDNIRFNIRVLTILSVLVVLFVLTNSVSAADIDINDTQIASASDNDGILSVENDGDVLSDGGDYNYSDLRDQISHGGNITLAKGIYRYVEGDGGTIEISSSVVIDGNGAVIDMLGSSIQVFHLNASNVIIKNLTIKDATYRGDGGAIWMKSGIVENCTFIDNAAYGNGGAVYFQENGNVTNCKFSLNLAVFSGGAVWMNSGSVENCTFYNNRAGEDEDAGGAVFFQENGNVTNCTFFDNRAHDGGAVRMNSGSLENCNFTYNTARDGGAIWMNYGSVENCTFSNNEALNGGAIVLGTGSVGNCNFTDNNVSNNGGAVVLFTGSVGNCTFSGNEAGDGGALWLYSGSAENCTFWENIANRTGGALSMGSGSVGNCTFSDNEAHDGGAIRVFYGDVGNCTFFDNEAVNGGAIYFDEGAIDSVMNCNFTNNTASVGGGAVFFRGSGISTNCNFTNNNAEYGGAIYFWDIVSDLTISGTYSNNSATWGGAIYFNGTVSGSNVTGTYSNNNASVGGANYFGESVSDSTISGTYSNNTATNGGGANYFLKNVFGSTINGTYINNKANGPTYYDGGGANHFEGSVSDSNVTGTYMNNFAKRYGGANCFWEMVSGSTVSGTYANNTVTQNDGGGANFFYKSVSDSNITGNYTNNTAHMGGANYFYSSVSDSNITGNYTNNKAYSGGANCFYKSVSGSIITGTYANNNATGWSGGANYIYDVSGSIITGTYANNTAINGGANGIWGKVSGSIITGTYTNNNATDGGANFFAVTVSDSNITGTYINNTAPNAIIHFQDYPDWGLNAEILNTIFLNNNCTYEIYVRTEGVVVKDSWFGNNASNFMNKPNTYNVQMDSWLFLNATADYTSPLISDSSNITFKLYSTNGTNVSDFDNSKLPVVNLTLTTTKGVVENTTTLDNVVKYTATEKGDGSVTAKIENASYTLYFDNVANLIISAPDLVKYYKGPERFIVTVTDKKDKGLFNKSVNITINGVTYSRTTDENGTASLNINLNSGEYQVNVAVDDEEVNSTVSVKATIDASDVVKMFRNDTQYSATFLDVNGTPLANTKVSFNINGMIYNRTTDENGTAVMNINLGAGEYIITAANPVTGEMKSNSIKVISLIESSDLTKYYKNDSQFVVRIHSDNGSYVGAGEEVKFNVNGVFYTKKTNATGHATLNINLPQGNYTITTYYKECSQGNSIEVLPILNASDLEMKYKDGSQFKATLVDGQGKAYAGQIVQFNINGMLYNKETDSDGIAKLNINLMPGEYIVTSSYNGFNIANTITISG